MGGSASKVGQMEPFFTSKTTSREVLVKQLQTVFDRIVLGKRVLRINGVGNVTRDINASFPCCRNIVFEQRLLDFLKVTRARGHFGQLHHCVRAESPRRAFLLSRTIKVTSAHATIRPKLGRAQTARLTASIRVQSGSADNFRDYDG